MASLLLHHHQQQTEGMDGGKKSHPTIEQVTQEFECPTQPNHLISCSLWTGCSGPWVSRCGPAWFLISALPRRFTAHTGLYNPKMLKHFQVFPALVPFRTRNQRHHWWRKGRRYHTLPSRFYQCIACTRSWRLVLGSI